MKMNRNRVAPENNFQKSKGWKGNKYSDRTNPNSDPFFVSKKDKFQKQETKNDCESFFVTKKEKTQILDRKNNVQDKKFKHKNDKFQGFIQNKSSQFDKFKGGKVDKNTNKKSFDKRKWRLQKYSKKYKLEQWEDKRKKAVLRGYYKEIKDDQPKMDVQKIYEEYDSENETNNKTEKPVNPPIENKRKNYVQNPNFIPPDNQNFDEDNDNVTSINKKPTNNKIFKGKPKNIAYKKAQTEFQRIKEEKKVKQEEFQKKKAEREEALLEYKKKKSEKFKKLNKKTKKGQPIMKDRIEMLLEKIQSSK